MVYISAQPDEPYFRWQLEVLLNNMSTIGISRERIHVLIGYKVNDGLNSEFLELIKSEKASFYLYNDERVNSPYAPSIRPHILKKHFLKFPQLKTETIFYHDADIIFRVKVKEQQLSKGGTWYLSQQAHNYLSYKYIQRFEKGLLSKMTKIIGIHQDVVIENDKNCGGAQYIMKNLSADFWAKLEKDSENLYVLIDNINIRLTEKNETTPVIQKWCADMWALLWNAWRMNINVEYHKELDFCWPCDDLNKWTEMKILHNSGTSIRNITGLFCKNEYHDYTPYYNNFNHIDTSKCTIKYIEAIRLTEQTITKSNLNDLTFIIPVRVDSYDRILNLDITTRFLLKHFKTNIIVVESDDIPRINRRKIDNRIIYHFLKSKNEVFNIGKCLNFGIRLAKSKFIAYFGTDYLCEPLQLGEAVDKLRNGELHFCIPFDGNIIHVNQELKNRLSKSLDLSVVNKSNYNPQHTLNSYTRCILFKKDTYIDCGLENPKIVDFRRINEERIRRIKILGYKIGSVKGSLLHLHHFQHKDELLSNVALQEDDTKEILNISSYTKLGLLKYIKSWL